MLNKGENESSKVEFIFKEAGSTTGIPDFDVSFDDNGTTTLRRSQFESDNNGLLAGPFETKESGDLTVTIFLLEDKLPKSKGKVSLPLKSDWRYRVIFQIDTGDPTEGCFGCMGYKSFEVDSVFKSSPSDSLYIIWGGNSLENEVIY